MTDQQLKILASLAIGNNKQLIGLSACLVTLNDILVDLIERDAVYAETTLPGLIALKSQLEQQQAFYRDAEANAEELRQFFGLA
jgi:hypothetical protein